MKKEAYMSDSVTFPELLAVIIKNIRKVIACTLIFALLLGAYGVLWYYVLAENPDEEYEVALADYEMTVLNLETTIERTSMDLIHQTEYNEHSHLMQIDPYNRVSSTLVIAISNIDTSGLTETFAAYETPISYMTSRIINQYTVLWNQMSLQEIVKGTYMEGSEEKYLREVIAFNVADGGVMNISVDGKDTAECEHILNLIFNVFKANKQMVEDGSYAHEFTMLSNPITKISVDLNLEKVQMDNEKLVETYEKDIIECRKMLLEMDPPSNNSGWRGIILKVIIGGVIGCIMGCIWVIAIHMTGSKVTGAAHVIDRFSLCHLGTLAAPKDKLTSLANNVLRERVWNDRAQALDYLAINSALALSGVNNLVLVSDIADLEESVIAEVTNALKSESNQVTFVSDLQLNANSLAAVRNADGIVLLERPFASKTADMQANIATAQKVGKPICGFVLV